MLTLTPTEALCGLNLIGLGGNFRPIAEGLVHQRADRIGGRLQLLPRLHQIKRLLRWISQDLGEQRKRGLLIILRVEQQQLRLRHVDVGKTDVELRA